MKRFLSLFLTFILIFNTTFLSFSYADTISDLTGVGFDDVTATDTEGSEDTEMQLEDFDEGPTLGTILSKIFNPLLGIISWIHTPILLLIYGMPTIDGCIFNSQSYFKLSFFDVNPEGLAGGLQGYIGAVYNAFRYLVTAVYIVVLVYLGVRMILSSVGKQKAQYKDLFKHWLIGLLILFSFHWVMAGFIWLANTFVGMLQGIATNILDLSSEISGNSLFNTNVLTTLFSNQLEISPITSFVVYNISQSTGIAAAGHWWNVILAAIYYLCLLGIAITIAFTYLKRLFTIALLIVLFPFVALSYVFDKIGDRKAQTLNFWLKEFTINVMIQPIHALLLVLIAAIYSTGVGNVLSLYGPTMIGALMSLLTLLLIPTGEKLLRQMFQINSSMGPGNGGIGRSLAQAGLAFRGAKELGSSMGKVASTAKTIGNLKKRYGINGIEKNLKSEYGMKKRLDTLKNGPGNLQTRVKNAANLKRDTLEKNADYQNYKKELLKATGTSSIRGASTKALAEIGAASFGVGTAIASSDTLSGFASKAVASASIGNATVDGIHKAHKAVWGDANASKDYTDRIKTIRDVGIENLTAQQKAKIKAEIGIDLDKADLRTQDDKNRMTAKILNDYQKLETYTKFGGTDKDAMKAMTSNATAVKNIENGKMPDGSGPLDKSRYTVTQDKKDAIYTDTLTGEQIFFEGKGNSKLAFGEVITRSLAEVSSPLSEDYVNSFVSTEKNVVQANERISTTISRINDLNKTKGDLNDLHTRQVDALLEGKEEIAYQKYLLGQMQSQYITVKQQLVDHPKDAELQKQQAALETQIQVQKQVIKEAETEFSTLVKEGKTTATKIHDTKREIFKADEELQRNQHTLSNARDSATEKITTLYSTMDESLTERSTPSTPETIYDPNSIVTPPILPIFLTTGGKHSEILEFLNGKTHAMVVETVDGIRIDGTEFLNVKLSPTCSNGSTSVRIILQDDQWVVEP